MICVFRQITPTSASYPAWIRPLPSSRRAIMFFPYAPPPYVMVEPSLHRNVCHLSWDPRLIGFIAEAVLGGNGENGRCGHSDEPYYARFSIRLGHTYCNTRSSGDDLSIVLRGMVWFGTMYERKIHTVTYTPGFGLPGANIIQFITSFK